MKKKHLLLLLYLLTSVCISGCVIAPHYNTRFLQNQGFEHVIVKGNDFQITTLQKIQDFDAPYVFYIEGDGAAFNMYRRPSSNPTPRSNTLINLAFVDKRPNIIYLARPCQYTPQKLNPQCRKQYWSNKRFADELVESMNIVINKINGDKKFHLVGFSGGGGMAILIAARNPKVKNIVTFAGNLNHRAFTTMHGDSPMIGSLNPIEYVSHIRRIPQIHYIGAKDRIISPAITSAFIEKADSPCVKMKLLKKTSHNTGWYQFWHDEHLIAPTCTQHKL